MTDTSEATSTTIKSGSKRPRKMARKPKVETADQQASATAPAKRQSKANLVLRLLQRTEGATIDQLIAATGWLPHTNPDGRKRGSQWSPDPDHCRRRRGLRARYGGEAVRTR